MARLALVELGVVEPALGVAQFGYMVFILSGGLNDKTDIQVRITEIISIRLIAE